MVFIKNTVQNIYSLVYRRQCNVLNSTNHFKMCTKYFQTSSLSHVKMFKENENKHACNIMEKNGYAVSLNIINDKTIYKPENFENVDKKKWHKETPQTLFTTLRYLGEYCSANDVCISDNRFNEFIDNLTDKIKLATDEELKSIFISIANFPETKSIRTRNFIEIWAALDDECLNRIQRMSFDEMLSFVSLFYLLNVTRFSDFSHKCFLKLSSKGKKLSKQQLVKTMFYIGVMRCSKYEINNLELSIEDKFSSFNIDELAVISMGFFKSKTPIRNLDLVAKIIDKIMEHSKDIHEVSLAALLKVIRYSGKIQISHKVYDLLDCLQHQVPRLSIMCNVHIALVGTSTLTLHKDCLRAVAEQTMAFMPNARVKDLERLVLTFVIFDFIPETSECFVSKVLADLSRPDREDEINQHGRAFASCIAYCGLLGFYPEGLISKVLQTEFLKKTYGNLFKYGREIITLHNFAAIFCKRSDLSHLSEKEVIQLAKKYTDYVPDENYLKQYNVTERMFLDVKMTLQEARGGKEYVTGYHLVPHHQRGDIIICNNHDGTPVAVADAFPEQKFGLLCTPPDDNCWIVLIIAGKNAMLSYFDHPTGHFKSKVRELNALGFYAAVVSWNEYNKCLSVNEKNIYLNNLIKEACNKKILKNVNIMRC